MTSIACYIRDEKLSNFIKGILNNLNLPSEGFASDNSLLSSMRHRKYDLLLMDTGTEVEAEERIFSWLNCRAIENTPVFMVSPAVNANLAATALNAGADDFLSMPLAPAEFGARLRAILRRSERNQVRRTIELAGFSLDRVTNSFLFQGAPVEMTEREFSLAWLFFSSPGVYISRDTIARAIWGMDGEIASRSIEQHVYKLRKKLQECANRGTIRAGYNRGYRLELRRV